MERWSSRMPSGGGDSTLARRPRLRWLGPPAAGRSDAARQRALDLLGPGVQGRRPDPALQGWRAARRRNGRHARVDVADGVLRPDELVLDGEVSRRGGLLFARTIVIRASRCVATSRLRVGCLPQANSEGVDVVSFLSEAIRNPSIPILASLKLQSSEAFWT